MKYIENIQIVFEDNTRTNIKLVKPIMVYFLDSFRTYCKVRLYKGPKPIKHIHFTYYEGYSDK